VLKLWQGLGYYTRARNLHTTAKKIVNDFKGVFPRNYEELLKLKGIGAYTASAIASIAFGEPVALVDGNVSRVLSRLYGIDIPVDSPAGKHAIGRRAAEVLNPAKPDIHNQALMEFGALVCLPKNPDCGQCVLSQVCVARNKGMVSLLPVKKGKIKTRIRYFYYLFIQFNNCTYLYQRIANDIWNSLYEFPLIESDTPLSHKNLVSQPVWKIFQGTGKTNLVGLPRIYRHCLTHQTLHCSVYHIRPDIHPDIQSLPYIQVSFEHLTEFAVPRIIDRYLTDMKQEGIL
jgi:A/G-specific adenine glycosylase